MALLGTAFFMVILDSTIVLTAVPSMQEDLRLSVSGVQWVLIGYALAFGGLMLLGGRVADLLGRRRVFMAGVALFAVSSLLCGLAWTGGVLIVSRAVQGVSAALMAPTALSIVMSMFGEGADRNKALGIWGGLGGVGATAGLLVGGVVTAGLGWEWIFYINVPVAIALLALSPLLLQKGQASAAIRTFDAAGATTITAALLLLVYAVFKLPESGWASVQTTGLLMAASVLVAVFVVVESRSAAPLVPLRVFRMRTLVSGNLTIFTVGLAVDGMLFPLTLYAQEVLGYSALQFGLLSAVMTVMSIAGAMAGQSLVTRLGVRATAVPSMLLMGLGSLLLVRVPADGSFVNDLLLGLLIFGPGLGGAFVASQIAALTGVSEEESGLASGLVDTSFNIGSAVGISIVTMVAVSRTDQLLATGRPAPVALAEGYQSAFWATVVFAGVGLLAALLLRGTPDTSRPAEQVDAEPVATPK
ncbi:MFS transporter [Actinomadura soli]|uniref:MFS transporter n=1 Tax=Actinomadura soli TaxID=2508997 RepID=UPI0014874B31|nr:MFS transporter [Actinomadura soli]